MTQVPPSGPSSWRAVVLRPAGIGTRTRLGEPVPADDRAAGHRDQELLLLFMGAGKVQRATSERRVRGHDQPERAPDAADLLDRDGVGEGVEPGPALVLGDRDAQPAHLAEPLDDLDWEAALAFVLIDDRSDLALHEVTDRRSKESVLGGKVKIHGRSVPHGSAFERTRARSSRTIARLHSTRIEGFR